MSPVEGEVRNNPKTGEPEIYRGDNEGWVPYMEFDPAERDAPVELRAADEWERIPLERKDSEE